MTSKRRPTGWQPPETAPKDRRILAYGKIGAEPENGIGTVRYDADSDQWRGDPSEAAEYEREPCVILGWLDTPRFLIRVPGGSEATNRYRNPVRRRAYMQRIMRKRRRKAKEARAE